MHDLGSDEFSRCSWRRSLVAIAHPTMLLLFLWLNGCGTTPSADPLDPPVELSDASDNPDAGTVGPDSGVTEGVPVGQPCRSNSDCGDGWCIGDSGCDTTWLCAASNPCSAAPALRACTCDGLWSELSAGCPEERWAFADQTLPDRFLGTFCDAQGEPPSRVDVIIAGVGFDAFNGQRVSAVFQDSVIGRNEPIQTALVVDGQFTLRWASSFDRSSFGYFVTAWFDSGDGLCDASESPLEWFANNNFALTDPLVVEVTPATSPAGRCP